MEPNLEEKPSGVTAVEPEKKPEEVTFQKIAEGSVDGQVACVEGPVRQATISIGMISTFSDSKGNFLLEHVPPGIAKIRTKSPTSRFYDSALDVLVETAKRNNLFIFLAEVTGTVEGTITDELGKSLVGAEVSGLFRLGKDAMITKSDEKGHYVFAEVPRGAYYVRAKAQGYMTEGATVNVTGGSSAVTDFKLIPGALSISGKVLDKQGSPVDCEIYLMRKGLVVTRTKTSSSGDGTYTFNDLVPDIYEMGTTSPGHMAKGWRGKLEKAEVVNFDLEEMPAFKDNSSGYH